MTTPHNYLGRISPLQFSALNPFWPLQPQALLNTSYNLAMPVFTSQHPISYTLNQNTLYKWPNDVQFNPKIGQVQAQPRHQGLNQPANRAFQKKLKKNSKSNQPAIINLISDDEEPCQHQKTNLEKNTSTNFKTNEQNAVPNSPTNNLQKQEPNIEIKNHDRENNDPKPQKKPHRIQKTKQIIKPSIQTIIKQLKTKVHSVSECRKQREIYSKRIVEKQGLNKQNYRVSKRQRQLLQVSFLRDSKAEILTGPQFQTRLPKFIAGKEETKIWLHKLKFHLLQRKYKEQKE